MKPHHHNVVQSLTIEEACRYSGLSDGTIRAYIRGGYIVSANVILPGNHRGSRLINRPSLDAFIERYAVGTRRKESEKKQELMTLLATAADALDRARRILAGAQTGDDADFPSLL